MAKVASRRDASLVFGHPRGLIVLAGTELWDRISFSGMQAILVLYMVERLFAPGRTSVILGFGGFRTFLERITGHLSAQGLATQIFGLYVGLTYLTPLFGGVIGDRWLGRKRAVILGALLMTAGHFCMAFEASFLLALALIVLGAGFLRGNLTPQVTELYTPDDPRRRAAFQIYASMVALGAFVAPLVTGWLSYAFDWHVAFAFAGFGMVVGLIWYLAGRDLLPEVRREAEKPQAGGVRPEDGRAVRALLVLIPLCTLFWIAQAQIWNVYNLWVRDRVDLVVGGWTIPVPWLQALDGLAPLLTLPLLLAWWRARERAGVVQDEIARMATGCFIFGGSVLLLASAGQFADRAGKAPLVVPVLFHITSNVGWLYFSPSANSLFTSAAPARVRGTMVGCYTTSMFLGSVISGRLGAFYGRWSAGEFWLLHAAVVICAGAGILCLASWLRRATGANLSQQFAPVGLDDVASAGRP